MAEDGPMIPWSRALVASMLGVALGVSGLAALADPPRGGYAPDPVPHASRTNWIFDLRVASGKVAVDRVKPVSYERPVETQRVVGRFALELYIGAELLDRIRFDVPLMGGETSIGNRNGLPKPRFDQNVTAQGQARIADNPRAAYLLLVDRQTGESQKFAWPPDREGHLAPWRSPLSSEAPGDFPDGGLRAVGLRDGATDASPR